MGKIHVLSSQLVDRIAAGEVVERPASVVKELVENALDAGARHVRVEVGGGDDNWEIAVTDDGEGMAAEDARLCFLRHATSKLQSADQLARIATLGFRGEALAAIASVARVEVLTRWRHGAAGGTRVVVEGGRLLEVHLAAAPPGTRVRVERLFYNTPARRRFLHAAVAERRACVQMAMRLAVGRPEVGFDVWVNDRQVLVTPGDGSLRSVAAAVLGPPVAETLLEVELDSPAARVRGLIGPPGEDRPTRTHFWVCVNGRWIDDRTLILAAARGYETALRPGRHPVGILHLEMDPAAVDVNVHPAKLHVRFRDEHRLFGLVTGAVRRALASAFAGPAAAPGATGVAQPAPALPSAPLTPPLPMTLHEASPVYGAALPAAALPTTGLRVLGQLGATYILVESPRGLLVLDQHVAHERILYERLLARYHRRGAPGAVAQRLLHPVTVWVGPLAAAALERLRPWLDRLGFEVEDFGLQQWRVRSVPAELVESVAGDRAAPAGGAGSAGTPDTARLERLVQELAALAEAAAEAPVASSSHGGEDPVAAPLTPWEHRLLATLACRSAVVAGQHLPPQRMQYLVDAWARTGQPFTCPHGRPVVVEWSLEDLNRRFQRPATTGSARDS